MSPKIIESQVKTILDQKNKGTLTPKVKKRKILFASTSLLTREEKEKLKGERQSIFFNETTTSKMYDLIEDWNFELNGKITVRSLAANIDVSKSSVEKYWKNIKSYVADLNSAAAGDIKLYREHKKNIETSIQEDNIVPYMSDIEETLVEQAMIDFPDFNLEDLEY